MPKIPRQTSHYLKSLPITSNTPQYYVSQHPSSNVSVLCTSALILRLLDRFKHCKSFVASATSKESPYSASKIENVQRDQVRTCTHILLVRLKEIRQREAPFGRSQSNEKIGESNLPYCPTTHSANIMVQVGMRVLVVATTELDTNKVC